MQLCTINSAALSVALMGGMGAEWAAALMKSSVIKVHKMKFNLRYCLLIIRCIDAMREEEHAHGEKCSSEVDERHCKQ